MMATENSYGIKKRLDFISNVLAHRSPQRVLDVGCGNGANLTVPLASQFSHIHFTAVDSDARSITFAKQHTQSPNLTFLHTECLSNLGTFDCVILSEVIEHVEQPVEFLNEVRNCLNDDGVLILTCPNGYGPFEWVAFAQNLMAVTGLLGLLQRLKHSIKRTKPVQAWTDTLAISPHVNFFRHATLRAIAHATGYKVDQYLPRTFLCGFGFDYFVKGTIASWNSQLANYLPYWINSGWMFVLRPTNKKCSYKYRRTVDASFRRWLNKKRWSVE